MGRPPAPQDRRSEDRRQTDRRSRRRRLQKMGGGKERREGADRRAINRRQGVRRTSDTFTERKKRFAAWERFPRVVAAPDLGDALNFSIGDGSEKPASEASPAPEAPAPAKPNN